VNNISAIKLKQKEPMMVTWDTGRRCNFDCSYCDLSRHDTFSPLTSLKSLQLTYKFIQEYTKLYNQPNANIAFTGGEPTVNPNFWQLIDTIENFTLGLTTNGTFPTNKIDTILNKFVAVTISWHSEIDQKLKDRAIENAILLSAAGFNVRVNVMMHTDCWNECIQAYDKLTSAGVTTNAVIIGDGNLGSTEFYKDATGTLRRTSHPYTEEQQLWYFNIKGLDTNIINDIKSGNQLPRSCCGNRDLMGKCNGCWTDITAVNTNFKGWFCSVNKYFMHIDQHTGNVYHHQTCKAKFNNERGPIGNLKNTDLILDYVSKNANNTIVCPNLRCGCGMCAPKAQNKSELDRLGY
jgi:MoaA/NifB/PqqE/SkfB family radical SAM enzyme